MPRIQLQEIGGDVLAGFVNTVAKELWFQHISAHVDVSPGNRLAQARITFEAMNSRAPIFYIPPYTSVPDYVGADFRDPYLQFAPCQPRTPKDAVLEITHQDAESALKAAKLAAKEKPGRYFGRATGRNGVIAFNVYENGKAVIRHIVQSVQM